MLRPVVCSRAMNPALLACVRALPAIRPIGDAAQWWSVWLGLDAAAADPAALAIAGGFAADRVGWAFAAGYQAALRALVPDLPHDTLAAFCVTESGGNRPRDIRTTITPQPDGTLRLDGAKRWTTLGTVGTVLLVVGAMPAEAAGSRPQLRVARVSVPSAGLALDPIPPTPFVPEVPHAQVRLHDVRVDARAFLPGDGYDRYVKPFRTIEDVHVTLAVLAYLLREARQRRWPAAFTEELFGSVEWFAHLAVQDARAPLVHLALAGALTAAQRLYAGAASLWSADGEDPAARRWLRDAPLFDVAAAASRQRAERAWESLDAGR